jgi:hypothetical protein
MSLDVGGVGRDGGTKGLRGAGWVPVGQQIERAFAQRVGGVRFV